MAKKKKKELTYESAKERLEEVNKLSKEANSDLRAFYKEHGLKKAEDHSKHKDKKIASAYKKLKKVVSDLKAEKDELRTFVKENKPKKERSTKYNYPDGLDAEEKKKFRTKMRASAKRAGVEVDEYLSDPEGYDAKVKEEKKAKKDKKKSKKKSEKGESKPKKEKKAKSEDKPKKKKKKKKSKKND